MSWLDATRQWPPPFEDGASVDQTTISGVLDHGCEKEMYVDNFSPLPQLSKPTICLVVNVSTVVEKVTFEPSSQEHTLHYALLHTA